MKQHLERLRPWLKALQQGPLEPEAMDLRSLRRELLHSMLVGLLAGILGAGFFGITELVQHLLLEGLAGYTPLRALGEAHAGGRTQPNFRPWLLVLLPALGGLVVAAIARYAPEVRGGGTDTMIDAFHHRDGVIRLRVLWAKLVASIAALGTGAAGGREGPTMLLGGALGTLVARLLSLDARERRILVVAGAAAGIAAVFRTPLGAALLAVEVLYRDGFESEALVPAVLSSVTGYSVAILLFGETTLFAHSARYPFIPAHLPLYALLALVVAFFAIAFVSMIEGVRGFFERLKLPLGAPPAVAGLALGVLATVAMAGLNDQGGRAGQGLGILGGGYGAAQIAISGGPLLGEGWDAVQVLMILGLTKLLASSLTLGSGSSAGDFAPSLALGGLFGGAFGRVAQLLFDDPRLDPGAFALVGMGAFYGGIAHVPLAAMVLVCEMARSYDLLVPLMLAEGVAVVVLRRRTLYHAQLKTPVRREPLGTRTIPPTG